MCAISKQTLDYYVALGFLTVMFLFSCSGQREDVSGSSAAQVSIKANKHLVSLWPRQCV